MCYGGCFPGQRRATPEKPQSTPTLRDPGVSLGPQGTPPASSVQTARSSQHLLRGSTSGERSHSSPDKWSAKPLTTIKISTQHLANLPEPRPVWTLVHLRYSRSRRHDQVLYDPAETDLAHFLNSWSAGLLRERLYIPTTTKKYPRYRAEQTASERTHSRGFGQVT